MRFRCRLVAIDLDQNEPGQVVRLLHHIESGDARLLDAVLRIFDRSFDEIFHGFGIHMDVDMDD